MSRLGRDSRARPRPPAPVQMCVQLASSQDNAPTFLLLVGRRRCPRVPADTAAGRSRHEDRPPRRVYISFASSKSIGVARDVSAAEIYSNLYTSPCTHTHRGSALGLLVLRLSVSLVSTWARRGVTRAKTRGARGPRRRRTRRLAGFLSAFYGSYIARALASPCGLSSAGLAPAPSPPLHTE